MDEREKPRFRGSATQKVDGKGRVSIPADFRRVIEAGDPRWCEGRNPEFVIVYGDDRWDHLECYTRDEIDEVDRKIARMPRYSKKRRYFERIFNGYSQNAAVDETGRIVLPQKLRNKIGLKDEAFFIASGATFEIWKPDTFEAVEAETGTWADEVPDGVDPMAFLDMEEDA